jgi:hypothetical protein
MEACCAVRTRVAVDAAEFASYAKCYTFDVQQSQAVPTVGICD